MQEREREMDEERDVGVGDRCVTFSAYRKDIFVFSRNNWPWCFNSSDESVMKKGLIIFFTLFKLFFKFDFKASFRNIDTADLISSTHTFIVSVFMCKCLSSVNFVD